MTVIVTAQFIPTVEGRLRLLDALREFIPRVHSEAGCEYFALHEAADGSLLAIEKWESADHLRSHDVGTPVADFRARLVGILTADPVVVRHSAIPLGDPAKGSL